jgi:tetratricopeptide (TPR) repeat protein
MGKSSRNSQDQAASTPWIYGPWLDLIVGCGAWSAPLLLLSYLALPTSARTWAVAFYALALFFNYPHYMATIYRAYHRSEDFQKYRIFTVHITAILLATVLLSHFWPRMLPWIFTIYLTWSPWHYSGQNYGLFMMFARRAGADPDKSTRRALYGAFIASYLILFLGFHTGASTDSLFISLGIPAVISRFEQGALCVAFVILSVYGLSRLARVTGWRKLLPSLTLFSSQFLWFLLPAAISLVKGLEIPQSRYSSGVLAIMHSAQYLWITSYYARREASGEGRKKWRPLAYFAVLVVGGIALFVPGPWFASRILHHDFTASFLIFTALVNIHHFVLDGAIWKLRDGRIAALLLNSRERIADAATETGGRLVSTWRWLTGGSASAHWLRVGTAAMLLLWGTADQARYYLALHTDDLEALQHAAALNSFDSGLQMRVAAKELAEGNSDQAEAALKKAIKTDPSNPAPRQALLKLLIDGKRYDEALDAADAALKYSPRDANLLVDHGFLEMQQGHADRARADWDQAIAVDSKQVNAHLYLADELDREGEARAAASHYGAFLEGVSRLSSAGRPAPERVIAIVLRMADCQVRSSQTELAVKSYRLAENLAQQTGQKKLESLADVNQAALQSKAGRLDDALQLYQSALHLDESVGDESAQAEDWLAYGRFLDEAGFPARLAYACMVKAESLMQSLRGRSDAASVTAANATLTSVSSASSTLKIMTTTRAEIEKRLGAQAAAIRRDPAPALQEALALRR